MMIFALERVGVVPIGRCELPEHAINCDIVNTIRGPQNHRDIGHPGSPKYWQNGDPSPHFPGSPF